MRLAGGYGKEEQVAALELEVFQNSTGHVRLTVYGQVQAARALLAVGYEPVGIIKVPFQPADSAVRDASWLADVFDPSP